MLCDVFVFMAIFIVYVEGNVEIIPFEEAKTFVNGKLLSEKIALQSGSL